MEERAIGGGLAHNACRALDAVALVNVERFRIITSPYLTDTNNWYLIDSRMAGMYLKWYWRVQPEFQQDPTSDYNLAMKYRGYMRFSFGWDSWMWIYGNEVA